VEELTVPACGETPASTLNIYRGIVMMTVRGVTIGAGPTGISDAFYSVESAASPETPIGACPECFRYNPLGESGAECQGMSRPVSELLAGEYPEFTSSHDYSVRLDLSALLPTRLAFTISDCGCWDNSGTFELRLETVCEP
jgi:hypothetical protein